MSLGIFSFDLAAIIKGLSNFTETTGAEIPPPISEITLERTEDVLQAADVTIEVIEDVLTAAALSSAVTPVIAVTETVRKETAAEKKELPVMTARPSNVRFDEETRREIERLIRALQTSVIHNYKSTDIIGETVSLNRVANFPHRNLREDAAERRKGAERTRKKEELKLEMLRAELHKAILRNNRNV